MSRKRAAGAAAAEHMLNLKDSVVSVSKHGMKFRASVSSTVLAINVLVVGFLVIPTNVLYFLNHTHRVVLHPGVSTSGPPTDNDTSPAYHSHLHSGIGLVVLGTLALVTSIVMSVFVVRRRKKAMVTDVVVKTSINSVIACLVLMNVELFMAIIAGAMELLYRPLAKSADAAYTTECVVSATNLIVYAMYIVSVVLTTRMMSKDPAARYRPSDNPHVFDYGEDWKHSRSTQWDNYGEGLHSNGPL